MTGWWEDRVGGKMVCWCGRNATTLLPGRTVGRSGGHSAAGGCMGGRKG